MTPEEATKQLEELSNRHKVLTIMYDLEEETLDVCHTGVSFCEALGMVTRALEIMTDGPVFAVQYEGYEDDDDGGTDS